MDAPASVDCRTLQASVVTPSFEGAVEAPLRGHATASHFVVRGWCYERTGIPIRAVRLNCAGRTFAGTYGHDRLNLFAALGGSLAEGGLGFEVPVGLGTPAVRCALEAQIADGTWHHVLTLPLQLASGSRERNWRAFWRQAWRGEPDVWHDLSEEERDFAAASMRVRGWFNLALAPQRPPRPVAFESFPTDPITPTDLPRLTVVTPSFQQATFLEDAITSVLDQDGVGIDYIIEDGGSTDGSVDIIRRYEARLAHSHSGPDAGQGDAIARGFARRPGAPSDLMMFLNADDVMLPASRDSYRSTLATHPDIDVSLRSPRAPQRGRPRGGPVVYAEARMPGLAFHDLILQETLFWRRRIWDRVGGIDPTLQFALDWDLLLRFQAAGARFARMPWFLGGFRIHARQKTQTQLERGRLARNHALRRRTSGPDPTADELHAAMRRAQVDSALVWPRFSVGAESEVPSRSWSQDYINQANRIRTPTSNASIAATGPRCSMRIPSNRSPTVNAVRSNAGVWPMGNRYFHMTDDPATSPTLPGWAYSDAARLSNT